ncbi:MAG TPA: hypothetical protein VFO10_18170 [Oligoflexus sp.]|uniref:hypothetical protein n=1 Tax=Oligoflexus sp. TaxID=1971216 RepID=UPI002D80E43E|nr:hypothetical protein [Oligoflexus sp.]HET9239192.1 hypothetical protein [Oligoflexus sp.]
MEKESPYLNVYLGSLKKPWSDYCETLGKKPGAALKEAIQKQLENVKSQPEPLRQVQSSSDDQTKLRVEILLTPSEKTAIKSRAKLERCSQRRWIIDAIRAGLTREPQFEMKEIEALGESNYQLLAIGRNLNQMTKAMNEGCRDPSVLESIQSLRRLIDAHTAKVSDAIRASLERWNIE